MSAFKQFLAKDIKVVPFTVNKNFTFLHDQFHTSSADIGTYKFNVGIDRFIGTNETGAFETSNPTTGEFTSQYERTVYHSIKELYYSNYLSSSRGDDANFNIPALDTGSVETPSYYNYLSSDISIYRYFPTASESTIGVISIPSKLFGEYIEPKSFNYICSSGSLTDDGEGNLIYSGSLAGQNDSIIGNIIYEHGIAILTSDGDPNVSGSRYGEGTYGASEYGNADQLFIRDLIEDTNVTCSFKSAYTIYETQYKCTARESEFNFSLNPSLIKNGATGSLVNFATGSFYSPYITTVGLYDDEQNLLAVGKLAQPVQSSRTTDTTILINIDR